MYRAFFKRFLDIIISLIAILILAPIFLVLVILVALFLGRPVFFKQVRPGKNNKLFLMWKFRSMSNEKDEQGNLLPDDKRLTKFGRFLRALSLDELPQLWNILKGDMSIVGPRPQLVQDMVFFDDEIALRQSVTPGLTGYAQIMGRNNVPWEEKFKNDLIYIKKITFLKDLVIVFKTFVKVFSSKDVSPVGSPIGESYGDWLLKEGKITKEEYDEKIALSERLIEKYNEK